MITKNDILLLLTEMQNRGIDTQKEINTLYSTVGLDMEVVKFINDKRQLDLSAFYENLRKNYNKKKSSLYINIVKEVEETNRVIITLSSLLLQILLYSKNIKNKQMFLRHARADEITKVLSLYFNNYDLTNCIKLLRMFKIDIKALESIK